MWPQYHSKRCLIQVTSGRFYEAGIRREQGSRVVVVGRLLQRAWTAEDGSARSTVEVVADEFGPSLRWATATTTKVSVKDR
jgi:single-stranded DNA-binding protein